MSEKMGESQPSRRWRGKGMFAAVLAGGALAAAGCSADVVAYDLPAESARYTFEAEVDGVHTEWEYSSDRPAEDAAPELRPCMGEALGLDTGGDPCRPEPLIFLRYDLGVDVENTLPAGRSQRVTVTGYYAELESPPEVTQLRLEVSFDAGQTWQPVTTTPAGEGAFTATIRHPQLDQTSGEVGLRVNAADSDGNTVVQTIPSAYRLR